MGDSQNPFEAIAFVQPDMISGAIILWSGAIVDIPSGFVICDGNNGTPDLRNKFIVGAGDTYPVAANGGTLTHTHNIGNDETVTFGEGTQTRANITGSSGTLPPYYSLAYIMKT